MIAFRGLPKRIKQEKEKKEKTNPGKSIFELVGKILGTGSSIMCLSVTWPKSGDKACAVGALAIRIRNVHL